eukprot:5367500-Amphidinium_carterae.1
MQSHEVFNTDAIEQRTIPSKPGSSAFTPSIMTVNSTGFTEQSVLTDTVVVVTVVEMIDSVTDSVVVVVVVVV